MRGCIGQGMENMSQHGVALALSVPPERIRFQREEPLQIVTGASCGEREWQLLHFLWQEIILQDGWKKCMLFQIKRLVELQLSLQVKYFRFSLPEQLHSDQG